MDPAAGGFDAKAAVQSSSSLAAINASFAWIPAIAMAIAFVALMFFDLDKHYDKAVEDLENGKTQIRIK